MVMMSAQAHIEMARSAVGRVLLPGEADFGTDKPPRLVERSSCNGSRVKRMAVSAWASMRLSGRVRRCGA